MIGLRAILAAMNPQLILSLARRRALAWMGAAVLPGVAQAQSRFPNKPIQLLVPFGPGGIADITARVVSEVMSQRLGQPIIVDNRPSAGSIVASQAVASARPDGHTLLLMSNGNAVSVGLFKRLPYDTQKGFAAISTLGYFDIGLFKNFNITERVRVQYRAEAFNAFNNTNFGNPGGTIKASRVHASTE